MKVRLLFAVVLGLSLGAASAQGQGQHVGPGGWGGPMGGGNGMTGTVTEVAADHYTIKTDTGETYTVHFSANTHILKQTVQHRGEGGEGGNSEPAAPQKLNPADIKVGDVVAAVGEVDAAAKSVGAMMVLQIDPERAKQMREMRANYGKTWLMGKVTAINETKITLQGTVDKAAHIFVANEDTGFRKRREYMTLADLQVGDMVRVEGAVKDGIFVATLVNVMGMPPGGMPAVPPNGAPASEPK
jgi:hypothetical protein